jgi:hypothetical protein
MSTSIHSHILYFYLFITARFYATEAAASAALRLTFVVPHQVNGGEMKKKKTIVKKK